MPDSLVVQSRREERGSSLLKSKEQLEVSRYSHKRRFQMRVIERIICRRWIPRQLEQEQVSQVGSFLV